MPQKKRFFTKNKKKILKSPVLLPRLDIHSHKKENIGNNSVNTRGKEPSEAIRLDKKLTAKKELSTNSHELPNNSQSITESVSKLKAGLFWAQVSLRSGLSLKKGLLVFFFILLTGLSLWQGIAILQESVTLASLVSQRAKLSRDLTLWANIAQKYPTYRDAYFQVAVLAYKLGSGGQESQYIAKTLELDPNYAPATKLQAMHH